MIKSLLVLTALSVLLSFSSAESCDNAPCSFDTVGEFFLQNYIDRHEAMRHQRALLRAEKARKAAAAEAAENHDDEKGEERKFAFTSHESPIDEFAQYRNKFAHEQNRKFAHSQQKFAEAPQAEKAQNFDVDHHLY